LSKLAANSEGKKRPALQGSNGKAIKKKKKKDILDGAQPVA